MQTAVDCNGSSTSSNSHTFAISTVSGISPSKDNEHFPSRATEIPAPMTLTPSPLISDEAPNVLRHRLQMGKLAAAAAATDRSHESAHSTVEQLSATPTSSPHASPSRKHQAIASATPTPIALSKTISGTAPSAASSNYNQNSSSTSDCKCKPNSSTDSISNSTTAAVISARNGDVLKRMDDGDGVNTGCAHIADHNDEMMGHQKRERTSSLVAKLLPLLPPVASKEQQSQQQQQQHHYFSSPDATPNNISTPMKSCLPTPTFSPAPSSTPSPSPPSSATATPPAATANSTSASTATSPSSVNASPLSATPAPSTVTAAATALRSKPAIDDELLHWNDMPQYLQFNPYVLNGYRPLQTFKGCLLSLLYWHNETINILTHAIPIVYILAIVPGLMPWENGYCFLSFCHLFGSVAPWCGSFVYHLFMNIEKGENVYYRLLKLDMLGIWVSQSFGALPLVTATTFCFSFKWKWSIIISYCLMCLWGLYKALTATSPWQRRLCFALPFTMRSILTFLRTMGVGGGNSVALSHVYLQDGVSVLGGAIGAMRIPEKWFPGLVDFYLNSHNIMHVLVVLAVYSMHKATIKDFEWMSTTTCDAFANATNDAIQATLASNTEL